MFLRAHHRLMAALQEIVVMAIFVAVIKLPTHAAMRVDAAKRAQAAAKFTGPILTVANCHIFYRSIFRVFPNLPPALNRSRQAQAAANERIL